MKEKILSKQSIYYGDMKMPEGFEIDSIQLVKDITVYWNNWVNGKGAGKKIKYAIREARKNPDFCGARGVPPDR